MQVGILAEISRATGVAGMVGGQFLDLRGAGHASPAALRAGARPQDRAG